MADDPMGVAEPPDTTPMQSMADTVRGLSVGDHSPDYVARTATAAADMMELQTDWLVDQHRLIRSQHETIEELNRLCRESSDLIREMLGKPPE